jgi:metal-responsive CopG/Arc/MetJ family transcriptional regulator
MNAPVAVFVRMPTDMVERLDAWLAEIRQAQVGFSSVSRADLIRDVVFRAIEEHERKGKKR